MLENAPNPFSPEQKPDEYEYVPYDEDPAIAAIIADEKVPKDGKDLRLRMQAWQMQADLLRRDPENELYIYMANLADNELSAFLARQDIQRTIRPKQPEDS
ncbi:MAG: hypothetical protein WDN27_04035 [Candidatus Saccharibacteria bacterium]